MAYTVVWNSSFEGLPSSGSKPSEIDDKIRELKTSVRERIDNEHYCGLTDGNNQGVHREGATRAWYQSAEPTTRPDGTALSPTYDQGRIWVDSDDNTIYVYDGSSWVSV